jgi:hypothetical protein
MPEEQEIELTDGNSGFTLKELDEITAYREAGLPGIIEVTDAKLLSAFDLRLDGRPWREISKALDLPKVVLMHLGEKFNWHQRRLEFLEGYEMHMRELVLEEKIHSQYFIMKAMHVFRKRMGRQFDRYLQSGEVALGDAIDMDEMAQYIKMAQAVAALDAKGLARDADNRPAVGLNLGDGVTVKKLSDNTVEITPRQKSQAEMLRDLANSKRDQKNNETK